MELYEVTFFCNSPEQTPLVWGSHAKTKDDRWPITLKINYKGDSTSSGITLFLSNIGQLQAMKDSFDSVFAQMVTAHVQMEFPEPKEIKLEGVQPS
jgi:hypothetical protein